MDGQMQHQMPIAISWWPYKKANFCRPNHVDKVMCNTLFLHCTLAQVCQQSNIFFPLLFLSFLFFFMLYILPLLHILKTMKLSVQKLILYNVTNAVTVDRELSLYYRSTNLPATVVKEFSDTTSLQHKSTYPCLDVFEEIYMTSARVNIYFFTSTCSRGCF